MTPILQRMVEDLNHLYYRSSLPHIRFCNATLYVTGTSDLCYFFASNTMRPPTMVITGLMSLI